MPKPRPPASASALASSGSASKPPLARSTRRVFQAGSQQRAEGPFRQACEYIQNGRIGKIKEVWVGVGATSKPCDLPTEETPKGLEWDMWLGQAPERGYNDIICRND